MNAPAPRTALQAAADAFVSRFAARAQPLPEQERAAALFRDAGLPAPREEAWRYTLLRPLTDASFDEPAGDPAGLAALLPAIAGPRIVFANGRFRPDLSTLPDGIDVRTGAPAFGGIARPEREKLVALNTMLAEDGARIEVPDGVDAGTLLLVQLANGGAFHPRHEIRLGRGARLELIEASVGEGSYLHNPVFTAVVAEDATLVHLRIQREAETAFHLSTLYAEVAARGTYDSFLLTLGGRLARMEVHARLAGERATAHLNAAQLLRGTQHADFTTVVTHDAPCTTSRQTVKNVLTGASRGVFQGKIEVARAAQKTDGYQMNQALLLSPEAEIDSKPQLEIYADDVKCSHGATVGELDPEQLFYLRSRGIPEPASRSILVRAFLNEALDPIGHEEAREAMEGMIETFWEGASA
ncbi:Iron-sulfur cluster assembly protein SufD [Rhodovastum atsumiense]|uniref:Fe-S cluster assembly protein SufD n=1 Tax=Rhodovastum atsumiense TaxID=504468 RepID=A0A5M6IYT9_9PROT|nr:Fe-S cluster assembly protein SufD [Rhodovastum atsumiense]KAA5613109.1 Fe-S cluster assembly protein SufD [Rhodovastum atsumiense]CAH2600020.1 Iron-sulfur cluster assembly protein SufD [Rhodovastum atsumiense]